MRKSVSEYWQHFDAGKEHGTSIETLIVSSHLLITKGITRMLNNAPGVRLAGHAENRIEMLVRIHEKNPLVVLINDDENGTDSSVTLESIRSAISEFPNVNVLMIIKGQDFDKELTALKIGVKGVILQNFEREELINAINCVANGGLWHRRHIMEKFISDQLFFYKCRESETTEPSVPTFTRRELEIIQLAGEGKKNREIGNKLYISEKTVKHHMSKIFKKLNINKRTHLKNFL